MDLKEIIRTLMLSEFYFKLPLGERKQVVSRLWALYGVKASPGAGWARPLHPPGRTPG